MSSIVNEQLRTLNDFYTSYTLNLTMIHKPGPWLNLSEDRYLLITFELFCHFENLTLLIVIAVIVQCKVSYEAHNMVDVV